MDEIVKEINLIEDGLCPIDDYIHNTVNRNWNPHEDETQDLVHAVLGLSGEAGEVADLVKKHYFYGSGDKFNPRGITRENYIDELGDVFYYLFKTCEIVGVSPEHVMQKNSKKLEKRHKEGFNGAYNKEKK